MGPLDRFLYYLTDVYRYRVKFRCSACGAVHNKFYRDAWHSIYANDPPRTFSCQSCGVCSVHHLIERG